MLLNAPMLDPFVPHAKERIAMLIFTGPFASLLKQSDALAKRANPRPNPQPHQRGRGRERGKTKARAKEEKGAAALEEAKVVERVTRPREAIAW